MLARGPYPWELKRRIRGRRGHLSNAEAGRLLERVLHDGLENVVLAHLSDKNNRPELAGAAAREVLKRHRLHDKISLSVADQQTVLTVEATGKKHNV
jgi:phosphoribosyl 1,2-cyclic phosphodiesterase